MRIQIITGPAGAGKNTIAELVAQKRERCAIVDVDTIRRMLVSPHKAPWEGEEGKRQQGLGVKNACCIVKNFVQENTDVIILDVATNETLSIYRKELEELNPEVILLMPSLEEIHKRNTQRPLRLTEDEIEMLYHWQEEITNYDQKIDNTNLTPQEVANQLL